MSVTVSQPVTTYDVMLTCDRCGISVTTHGVGADSAADALTHVIDHSDNEGWSHSQGTRCRRCVELQEAGWQ